jgi:Helix-turn-helix domain
VVQVVAREGCRRGDAGVGAVLRHLRESQGMTLAVVADRAGYVASMVSQVETGDRTLSPALAHRLDKVYRTGGAITALVPARRGPGDTGLPSGAGCTVESKSIVLVDIRQGGLMIPVPRRALLQSLGLGVTVPGLSQATAGVPADEELLAQIAQSLATLQTAGRVLPPAQVVDPLIGQVAVLDSARHRAPRHLRRAYVRLQAQHADLLSWMVREAGDPIGATYWVDRVQHWAAVSGWPAMTAHAHIRRSMLAGTCAGDGRAAVEHANQASRTPGAPTQVRALAAKQAAYGHALTGDPDACARALDQTACLFDEPTTHDEQPDPVIGQSSISDDNLLAQIRGTCDVYLGGGEHAIPLLDVSRTAHGAGSRHGGITGARLARAYAQVGDPVQACALALAALGTGDAMDSLSTRVELRRALAPLNRWPTREDVTEVRHQITALA